MKLRIHDNSIRFRVAKSELAVLQDEGKIESWIHIPDLGGQVRKFIYSVIYDGNAPESRTEIKPYVLAMYLGSNDFESLCSPTQEGICTHLEVNNGNESANKLLVYVEKDRADRRPRRNK